MVFIWCALGYDVVLGNKADCHDKRQVSLWACCFCTLHVQKGLMFCVTLQNSWEGGFSGVLNWKRALLMRRAGLTNRREKPCVELCYFSGLLDSRDGVWWALPLKLYKPVHKVISLATYPPQKVHIYLLFLQLASCSAAVPALGLAICWRTGELCHLEPQTANSCSLDQRCRLRDNVKLIF